VQRAQQGAARALFPILFPIFGKANSPIFPPKKISNNTHFLHMSFCRGRREKKREEGAKGPIGLTDVWGGLAAQAAKPCKIVEHFALLSDRVPALACE
jgi:hypothetical protein